MKRIVFYIEELLGCLFEPITLQPVNYGGVALLPSCRTFQLVRSLVYGGISTAAVYIPAFISGGGEDQGSYLGNEYNEYFTDESGRPLQW